MLRRRWLLGLALAGLLSSGGVAAGQDVTRTEPIVVAAAPPVLSVSVPADGTIVIPR
jgi:hypothetical protein